MAHRLIHSPQAFSDRERVARAPSAGNAARLPFDVAFALILAAMALPLLCLTHGYAYAQTDEYPFAEAAAAGDDPFAEAAAGDDPFEEAVPLYQRYPFDVVVLRDADRTELEVEPIPFPDRKLPEKPKLHEVIQVQRLDSPEEVYEIAWRNIFEIRLFEHMVLNQANELVESKEFDEAYRYFSWLEVNRPKTDGLKPAVENFYFAEAKHHLENGRPDNGLVLLHQLHARNPQFEGLGDLLGSTTDGLVEKRFAEGRFASARRLLSGLRERFPNSPLLTKWEERIVNESASHVEEARRLAEEGKIAEAQQAADLAVAVRPDWDEAKRLAATLYAKQPRLVVGVAAHGVARPTPSITSWDDARVRRLTQRSLMEFTGLGADGGIYTSPFGVVQRSELGSRIEFRLRPNIEVSEQHGPLSAFDVARGVLTLADPTSPLFDPAWADLFSAAQTQGIHVALIDMARAHPQPAGLLNISPLLGRYDGAMALGPYREEGGSSIERQYVVNPDYFAIEAGQPHVIVERQYADMKSAIRDLRNRQIDMIDRIHPADRAELAADKELRVAAYATPTLHCLLPNHARPYPGNRSFRRAVAYAINREFILKDILLRGQSVAGCEVINGPFPRGANDGDPLGYAYDRDVAPLPHDPRMALTLLGVATREVEGPPPGAEKATNEGESESDGNDSSDVERPRPVPTLTIGYPPTDMAREACEQIERHLEALRINVQLKPFAKGEPVEMRDDLDFVYAELLVQDPVVDATRILGHDGILGRSSPYMNLALRRLNRSDSWIEATSLLREIHRLSYHELTVLPLWQIREHFVYRRRLDGVKDKPVSLYDGIEDWKSEYLPPVESL